jgi:sulfate adenylyltransferase subunit 2
MTHIDELVNRSVYILRETKATFKNPAVLWSTGKDSTACLQLCRDAFMGKVPFPVIHIDTGHKFRCMYDFRDIMALEWKLNLVVAKNEEALAAGLGPDKSDKLRCCTELKTQALKDCVEENEFDALILAIRRDEHAVRAKERIFSPRGGNFAWNYENQPLEMWDQFQTLQKTDSHMRVHPMLHWTELDVWEYVKVRRVPFNPMYLAHDGRRYRSLGCEPCTSTVESTADSLDAIIEEVRNSKIAERSGRAQDKEDKFTMQKIRALGYP